jgi:hypothetical protein
MCRAMLMESFTPLRRSALLERSGTAQGSQKLLRRDSHREERRCAGRRSQRPRPRSWCCLHAGHLGRIEAAGGFNELRCMWQKTLNKRSVLRVWPLASLRPLCGGRAPHMRRPWSSEALGLGGGSRRP